MTLFSLLFFILSFVCHGDDCPTSWGGELSSGNHIYVGCVYDSSNSPSQMNISKIGISDFNISNSNFTNISHRIVFFNSSTRFTTLSFIQCVFDNISSSDEADGGAMCLEYYYTTNIPTCTITSCTFQACKTKMCGGAFWIHHILVDITDSRFYSCNSRTSGGAIYLSYWNVSDSQVNPTTLRINNNDFASNTALYYGGSLYLLFAGNISFVGNKLCGGSASSGGTDIVIQFDFSGGLYETSCSDSPGCKVSYCADLTPIYRCKLDFPLPSCSAEYSQNACNPTAETCEERKPNANRETEKCGGDCILRNVSGDPLTCVSPACSDYDGTGHCPPKDCYLQPDGIHCKTTCSAGYTASEGVCVKNGNGENENDKKKNGSMEVSMVPIVILAVVAVLIW